MDIQQIDNGDYKTLALSGRVDKIGSVQLQNAILSALQKSTVLTLDFNNVEYISSSGLRALIIGHKTATSKGGDMKIININKEVSSVITLTGFDNILHFE